MDVQEVTGYKGNSRWFSRGGYFFVASRTRGVTSTLSCAAAGCRAHFSMKNDVAGHLVGQHNHATTPWVLNRNRLFKELKRRSAAESIPLNNIYLEEAARYPDAAPHLLFESVVPTMRGCRRAVQPAVPRTIVDYGTALAHHPVHGNMLLATVSAGGASATILAMPGFGECLRDSNTIIVDGTFRTVPAGLPAAQILTIHGVVGGNFFHPVLVLMENRRRGLYEAVFQRIWNAAGNPHPQHVVTDFEPALQSALEAVAHVPVQGCLFHFVQALLRRARQEGIRVRHGTPGWLLVQLHGALALLPPALVPAGLAEMPAIIAAEGLPASDGFNAYFQAHWMTRVGPARFSVHGSPHLTSNVAESFHASLGRTLGPAPNIWRFTDVAAEIFANSVSRLQASRAGQLRRRNRARSYLRAALVADNQRALDRGTSTLREFLVATARNMVVGLEVLDDDEVPGVGAEIIVEAVPQVEVAVEIIQDPLPIEVPQAEMIVDRHQQPILPPQILEDIEELLPEVVVDNRQELPVEAELVVDDDQQPLPLQAPAIGLCAICMDNRATRVLVPCGHVLCANCLEQLANRNSCPFCRAEVGMAIPFYL